MPRRPQRRSARTRKLKEGGRPMLKARVIPCLDVKDGRVVKGVQLRRPVDAGDPVEAAKAYDAAGADELTAFSTSPPGTRTAIRSFDVVAQTAEHCFMPLTVGGGVRTIADIRKLLLAGADKVSINTAAVQDPDFVAEAADKFGNQCIVVAIDAKRVSKDGEAAAGRSSPMAAASRPASTPSNSPEKVVELGAGEFLLTSMDRDGTQDRLRHRAHPRRRRCGARAGHRLGRRRHSRPSGRGHSRRPCQRRARRLDLPFRHLYDRRGQGLYGSVPAFRCDSTDEAKERTPVTCSPWPILRTIVAERATVTDDSSWTAKLVAGGPAKVRQETWRGGGRNRDRRASRQTAKTRRRNRRPALSSAGRA